MAESNRNLINNKANKRITHIAQKFKYLSKFKFSKSCYTI